MYKEPRTSHPAEFSREAIEWRPQIDVGEACNQAEIVRGGVSLYFGSPDRLWFPIIAVLMSRRMPMKKTFMEEQIILALREAEAGPPVTEVCWKLGVSEQSFYRW